MDALLAMAEEENWDKQLRKLQFGINNMKNQYS